MLKTLTVWINSCSQGWRRARKLCGVSPLSQCVSLLSLSLVGGLGWQAHSEGFQAPRGSGHLWADPRVCVRGAHSCLPCFRIWGPLPRRGALAAPAWIAISTHQKPNSLPLTPEGCKGHKLNHSQAELLETTLQSPRGPSSPVPLGSSQTSQANACTLPVRLGGLGTSLGNRGSLLLWRCRGLTLGASLVGTQWGESREPSTLQAKSRLALSPSYMYHFQTMRESMGVNEERYERRGRGENRTRT